LIVKQSWNRILSPASLMEAAGLMRSEKQR
jgi:hypothetical protein